MQGTRLYLEKLFFGRYTLDEYGTARRTAVVRCFIDALTRGGVYCAGLKDM